MTPAVICSPRFASFLHLSSPSHKSSTFHTHVHIFSPVCLLLSSHRRIICADHCCFSAWISSSSAWMNSYQIKLALADSDLPAPPLHIPPHTGIPRARNTPPHLLADTSPSILLSVFWLLAPPVIWGAPAECWGASVALGGSPKNPCGPLCMHSQRAWIFSDLAKTSPCFLWERGFESDSGRNLTKCWVVDFPAHCVLTLNRVGMHLILKRCKRALSETFAMLLNISHVSYLLILTPALAKKLHKVSFYFPMMYSARILGELCFFSPSLPLPFSVSVRSCVSDLWDACRLLPGEARCAHPTQTGSQNKDSATCAEFTSN